MFEAHFKVDEAHKTITVEREFAAPKDKVWQAWTDSKMLEKWWAPKPWKAITKTFDFTEGGQWLYYMSGPNGEKSWSIVEFEKINPTSSFSAQDAFCDENGQKDPKMPTAHWLNEFKETGDHTKVIVTLTFPDVESLKKLVEMGFQGGFTMGLENLDELLAA